MRVFTSILLLTAMLAGCAEDAAPVNDETTQDLGDVEVVVTKTTGAIRGVVVDNTVTPVADVTITLQGQDATATTNANGGFAFSKLEPGTYFMTASKLGFSTVQQSATVEAGVESPPVVKILLTRDATAQPEVVAIQWDGFMACGLSAIALCGLPVVDEAVGDDFLEVLEVEREGVTYLQSEMIWETTQSVSSNMQLWQEATGTGGCTFEAQNGGSPNIINTTFGDYNTHGNKGCFQTLGNTTDLRLRVFSGSIDGTFPPTENGCYPVIGLCMGVGATIEQSFSVFNHLFYGFKPFDGWTFGKDGAPETPTL